MGPFGNVRGTFCVCWDSIDSRLIPLLYVTEALFGYMLFLLCGDLLDIVEKTSLTTGCH